MSTKPRAPRSSPTGTVAGGTAPTSRCPSPPSDTDRTPTARKPWGSRRRDPVLNSDSADCRDGVSAGPLVLTSTPPPPGPSGTDLAQRERLGAAPRPPRGLTGQQPPPGRVVNRGCADPGLPVAVCRTQRLDTPCRERARRGGGVDRPADHPEPTTRTAQEGAARRPASSRPQPRAELSGVSPGAAP